MAPDDPVRSRLSQRDALNSYGDRICDKNQGRAKLAPKILVYIIPDGPGWWLVVRQGNLFMVVVGSGVEHTYCYLE